MTVKNQHLLIGCMILGVAVGFSVAQEGQDTPKPEGAELYTPTRVEWLAAVLNSQYRVSLGEQQFKMHFIPDSRKNKIWIMVLRFPQSRDAIVNSTILTARQNTEAFARSYGWDGWLQVEQRVDVVKDPAPTSTGSQGSP